jgi:hypothetical protein
MSQGDSSIRWCCPNPDCSWSMVADATETSDTAPRCACGGLMEKAEAVPVFTYLDLLGGETGEEESE